MVVASEPSPYPKLLISNNKFITYIVDLESKSPVGSSSKTIDGELANERAIALYYIIICTLFVASLLKASLEDAMLFLIILLSLITFLFFLSFVFSPLYPLFALAVQYSHKPSSMLIN